MTEPVADREPLSAEHPVYPGGPPCQPNCPGPWSQYHDGYADGYENADAARAHPDEAGLRRAVRAYLDAQAEPAYSWVSESQAARRENRPNREVERMERIARARVALEEALAQPAVPVAGAEEEERLATLVVQAFTEYATEGERAQAAGWRFLTAAYDIAQHRAPVLRAAQPEDDGLPDERAVATWPGGGGRVSHDPIDGAWFNDADGAWVVLCAPRQFFDGLRRLSESSEEVERRDGA